MVMVNYSINNYCTACEIKYLKNEIWCNAPNGCGNRIRMSPKSRKGKQEYLEKISSKIVLNENHSKFQS